MLARLGVSGILRLVTVGAAGLLALWYASVTRSPAVKARKAAWREERAAHARGRRR